MDGAVGATGGRGQEVELSRGRVWVGGGLVVAFLGSGAGRAVRICCGIVMTFLGEGMAWWRDFG